MPETRWPSWVYDEGEEPDYRFSLANERTFLAWVRTALALVAVGVALDTLRSQAVVAAPGWLAAGLAGAGGLSAACAWVRWARVERALRRGEPLPSFAMTPLLAGVALVTAIAVLVAGAA